MGEALDRVIALARAYERVEHGKVEHVGAYQSRRRSALDKLTDAILYNPVGRWVGEGPIGRAAERGADLVTGGLDDPVWRVDDSVMIDRMRNYGYSEEQARKAIKHALRNQDLGKNFSVKFRDVLTSAHTLFGRGKRSMGLGQPESRSMQELIPEKYRR